MRHILRFSRCAALLGVLLAALLSLFACSAGGATDWRTFGYLDAPFSAELTGKINGTDYTFRLVASAPTGTPADGTVPDFTVTFSSPAALDGVSVSYQSADESYLARLGEIEESGDFSRLCAPAIALLRQDAVQSTHAREDGTVEVTTQDGRVLTLSRESGIPTALRFAGDGRVFDFRVSWWEPGDAAS